MGTLKADPDKSNDFILPSKVKQMVVIDERTIKDAIQEMLAEYIIEELLEMIELLGDCYLEASTGGVDMNVIHKQRVLEKFLKKIDRAI